MSEIHPLFLGSMSMSWANSHVSPFDHLWIMVPGHKSLDSGLYCSGPLSPHYWAQAKLLMWSAA